MCRVALAHLFYWVNTTAKVSQVTKYLDKQLYWLFPKSSLVKPSEQG